MEQFNGQLKLGLGTVGYSDCNFEVVSCIAVDSMR
jgi:hypothetical protein